MRLCEIVPSLDERHGGPSKSSYELSTALAAVGHDVELLTTALQPVPTISEGRLEVRTFLRDWPQRACRSAGMRRRLRAAQADVVHHHSLWLRTLHYARLGARWSDAPLVVSPRGMMSAWAWNHHLRRKQLARWLLHPGAFAAVRGWHATSEGEAADIRALGFKQPVCVAPNGVRMPSPEQRAASERCWRETLPAGEQRPVALFYSRFHAKKRVLELIDLWLEHAPSDWLLLLVGIPQDYTPELLEDYALRASGFDRIRAFSGIGRPPPYGIASLFLLPSHSENFGLVIAEALAYGVPALVTDTTPWTELNRNQGGWCVPWAEYPAVLRAAVAEAPARLRERGASGREWVRQNYSWERPARGLVEFYQRLRT